MMRNFAKDLHRKGELDKVEQMEKLGKRLIGNKDMGLAFITEGFYGYDAFAVIPNSQKYQKDAGYIVFDEEMNRPQMIYDNDKE